MLYRMASSLFFPQKSFAQSSQPHSLIPTTLLHLFPWKRISMAMLSFSRSVVPDSLQPHVLQHARLPCPSPSPRACSNSAHWVSDAIQLSCPLSSPSPPAFNFSQHQGNFPMSYLFASGDQRIGASASASVLPMNIQGYFPLGLAGLISLPCKGLSRVFSSTTVQKQQFFQALYSSVFQSMSSNFVRKLFTVVFIFHSCES